MLMIGLILGLTAYVEAGKVCYAGWYLMVDYHNDNAVVLVKDRERATDFTVGDMDDFTNHHDGLYFLDNPSKKVLCTFFMTAYFGRDSKGKLKIFNARRGLTADEIAWHVSDQSPNYLWLDFNTVDFLAVEYTGLL